MAVDLTAIQEALQERRIDGWLFYDFRGSDPLSYSILGLPRDVFHSRRWFYFIPAQGSPIKIVHAIEATALDSLPGRKHIYLPWPQLHDTLRGVLSGRSTIAMQYSPNNAIPYISRVDAGTIELVRSFGVKIISSDELVQVFEATISDTQYASHIYAADTIAHICHEAFEEIGRRIRIGSPATEWQIQQFLERRFDAEGLITDHLPIVAVDAHSADPHFAPSPIESPTIGPNQSVLIDLWAKRHEVDAIYADITRVAFTGNTVPEEYQQIFRIVRDARDAAIEAVQTAVSSHKTVTGAAIDDVCREVIKQAGYGDFFIHRTGHSIHQSTHGNGANIDNLETEDSRTLIPHTLFSIEPGIYLPGKFGIRSEINIYLSGQEAIVTGPARQMDVYRISID